MYSSQLANRVREGIWFAGALLIMQLIAAQGVQAQTIRSTPDLYEIQILDVSLCTSVSCSNPVSLGDRSENFDIAGVGPNSIAGTYAPPGALLPVGNYTHVQIVFSRDLIIQGRIPVGNSGFDCITDSQGKEVPSGGVVAGAVTARVVPSGTGKPQRTIDYFENSGIEFSRRFYANLQALGADRAVATIVLPHSVTISADEPSAPRVNINIDVANTLVLHEFTPTPGLGNCQLAIFDPELIDISF